MILMKNAYVCLLETTGWFPRRKPTFSSRVSAFTDEFPSREGQLFLPIWSTVIT